MKITTRIIIIELVVTVALLGGLLGIFHGLVIPWQEENYSASGHQLAHLVQQNASSLDPRQMQTMIEDIAGTYQWIAYIYVVDSDSQVIAESSGNLEKPWRIDSPQIQSLLDGTASGTEDFAGDLEPASPDENQNGYVVNMALPLLDSGGQAKGAIVLGMAMDTVHAMNDRYYGLVGLFGLIWLLILGTVTLMLWKDFIQPIKEITFATRALIANNFSGRLNMKGTGEISGLAHDFDDMADRLQSLIQALYTSEANLTNQVSYLNHLIDNMNEFFFTYDKDTHINMVNRKFCESFGYTRDEVIGQTVLFFVPDKYRPKVNEEIHNRLFGGTVGTYEISVYYRDGSEHSLRLNSSAIIDKGEIVGGIVLAEDITDEKNSARDLRHARDQLEARVKSRTKELENSNKRLNEEIKERIKAESALIDSEQRLQKQVDYLNMLIDNLNEAFFTYDWDGKITLINSTFSEMLGFEPEDKLGTSVLHLVREEHRCIIRDHMDNRLLKGLTDRYEIPVMCKDQREKILRLCSSPIFENGRVIGGMVLGEDITDYRYAEKALQMSEEKFSSAFRNSPMLMSIISLVDGRYIEVNDSWNAYFGFEPGEVIGSNSKRVSIWTKQGERRKLWDVISEGHTVYNAEFKARKKNGDTIMCLWSCTPIAIEGEPCALLVGSDISARKRAEEALAAEKERLSVTLSNIGEGVITTDASGRIILMNEVVQSILNKRAEEFISHNIIDLLNEFNIKVDKGILFMGTEGRQYDEVFNILFNVSLKIDNVERIIEVNRAPIVAAEGIFSGHVWVMRDITEKQKMEEEFIKASKLESLGILAGGIAHDFNNLLTVIAGNLALCKMLLEENEEIQEFLVEAEKASFQAKGLTKQLLTFARGGTPQRQTTNIVELIRDTAIFALNGTNVRCEFDLQNNLWAVDIDKSQMSQVINNIVINGIQAMPEGGTISIRGENVEVDEGEVLPLVKGPYIKLSIRDQGIGITEEQRKKIFDPYFTTREDGSGLGLAISHSIVTKHQGYVDLDSTPGKGTIFYIYLPASTYGAAVSSSTRSEEGETAFSGYKGAILLMDDEPELGEVSRHILNVMGYYVQVARDGINAIELFKDYHQAGRSFNLVIIDAAVPGGGGAIEAARRILEIDSNAHLVVSSGFSNDPLLTQYSQWGFQASLVKPYGMMELTQVLEGLSKRDDHAEMGGWQQ